MFDNLREAWREAVDNFKAELNRDDLPEDVHGSMNRLMLGMRKEIAGAKSRLDVLNDQLAEARTEVSYESVEEATCRRREEAARRVGDIETARIATEYALRHARRRELLARKAAVIDEERSMRAAEIAEMLARLREVQGRYDALAATGTGSDDNKGNEWAGKELLEELERTASTMDGVTDDSRPQTIEGLEQQIQREYANLRVEPWAPAERPRTDLDERLSELKRRMGQK